ncbi:DUF1501 domain-containing protein [Maribius pontilimi]|uniref:DUF1501 domain-containing protein n=1 Tax=Palleronia pontilimi TaxID=1964209 RepID=A0A934IGW3_9RHOB|nr:DUF1501 domain-containing protein [Palleronia pontilimi]MBJ3762673.1 DUF1501 domain-containing protein [Palleronia pontilimi]
MASTRRAFLKSVACSAAAHPWMTSVSLAAAPWDARLVVIVLRGAMDGLDIVRPVGDPAYAGLRAGLIDRTGPGLPLDGYFELHPYLSDLMPLWRAGQLGFAHAVSTPYRDKRSHFDGQDLLEAGSAEPAPDGRVRDGWLNRLLQVSAGTEGETAYAIGRDQLRILRGSAEVAQWSPDAALDVSAQSRLLLEHVYHDDPLFRDTADQAIALAELAATDMDSARGRAVAARLGETGARRVQGLAAFAAERLYGDTRIASFSVPGWDSHRNQDRALVGTLGRLADVILVLRDGLGPVWDKTCVLAMTEFGRTVALNGSFGTDHGTGGAMLLAGGAVRGGRVLGDWPGLDEAALYDRRDLMPTRDVRAHAAWAMRGLFGIERSALERTVFPGLDMGADPGAIL